MASWVKTPDNRYINISQIELAYTGGHPDNGSPCILGTVNGNLTIFKDGFADLAAAQTALDNAIVNLGGSV